MERHALKKCSKCREEKSVSEFHKNRSKPGGTHSYCKACAKVMNAAYTGNPAVRAAILDRGTKRCSICKQELPLDHFAANKRSVDGFDHRCGYCHKSSAQVRLYGITLAQKEGMLAAQGGVCSICGTDSPGPKGWHTDHCHTSLKVRGVLCDNCNRALGFAKDNPTILRTMAAYIEMHAVI